MSTPAMAVTSLPAGSAPSSITAASQAAASASFTSTSAGPPDEEKSSRDLPDLFQ